jgi:hypothetical protein
VITLALITLLVAVATKATASSTSELRTRQHRQVARIHADRGALRFCANHPAAHVFCTTRRLRFVRARIRWTTRELAETRVLLNPWRVPAWFRQQALCVHHGESIDWHIVNPPYTGGMQFMDGTWQRVGGRGRASDASPGEQIFRAFLIWKQDGGSWREWPRTSRACGLA